MGLIGLPRLDSDPMGRVSEVRSFFSRSMGTDIGGQSLSGTQPPDSLPSGRMMSVPVKKWHLERHFGEMKDRHFYEANTGLLPSRAE